MTVPLPDLFKRVTLAPGGVRINTLVGGNESGTPVLLLHGYPQTHVMWHHVAPILAQDHHGHPHRPARLRRQRQAAGRPDP